MGQAEDKYVSGGVEKRVTLNDAQKSSMMEGYVDVQPRSEEALIQF